MRIIAVTTCVIGAFSPSLVYGSELMLQAVLNAFQEFSTQLKGVVDGIDKVKKEVNCVKDKLHENVKFSGNFLEGLSKSDTTFVRDAKKSIEQFDDTMNKNTYINEFRKRIGLGDNIPKNLIELESDVRKAYVVLQDANHTELQNGETPKQKVSRADLTRVHQQRGLILRNSAIKGIALSLEQQKEMCSERSSAIFEEVKEYMDKAESAKDFAHVQTMVMLAMWTELRQQRQLIAALLQSQAAINLNNDPLLVDISPAPKQSTQTQNTSRSTGQLTTEEQSFLDEVKKMNEEYKQKSPTQSTSR